MHVKALSLAAAVAAVIVCAQLAQASVRDSGDSPLAAISAAINADLTGSQSLESSMAASVEKSHEKSHADRATTTTTASTTTQQADRDKDKDNDVDLSPTSTAPVLTGSARPGWGCGDMNHKHTGPPGNPDAKSPCNKKP
jgi:hypothetical protein